MSLVLDHLPLWFAATNCWLLGDSDTGQAVLIDTPPDVDGIVDLVARSGLSPVAALITHAHVDHWGGAGGVAEEYQVRAYLHPDDDFLAADPEHQVRSLFGMTPPGQYEPPATYEKLHHDQRFQLAGHDIEVIHTPGHTPGHCCFSVAEEGILFSGDQLFAGSIGRTDLPGGSFEQLMESMATRVLTFPDDTRVLPGHGETTTIGRERAANPFLRAL